MNLAQMAHPSYLLLPTLSVLNVLKFFTHSVNLPAAASTWSYAFVEMSLDVAVSKANTLYI